MNELMSYFYAKSDDYESELLGIGQRCSVGFQKIRPDGIKISALPLDSEAVFTGSHLCNFTSAVLEKVIVEKFPAYEPQIITVNTLDLDCMIPINPRLVRHSYVHYQVPDTYDECYIDGSYRQLDIRRPILVGGDSLTESKDYT